jgi:hypothetical protein
MMRFQPASHHVLLVTVLLTGIVSAACDGTPTKSAASTQTNPPTNGAVAYDAARRLVVLVTPGVGQLPGGVHTWTWDGHLWTRMAPSVSPTARTGALIAYDESRRVTVLQGGQARTALTDTWEWDGSNWSKRTPAHSPDPGQEPALAYDPTSHRMLMYQFPQQLWAWDGRDWAQLHPAHLPGPLTASLTFDGRRVILFGDSPNGNRMETWGWTGDDWTLLSADHRQGPPVLQAGFNAASAKVVVCGGGPGDDTWTWNGTRWTREHPKHSPADAIHQMVYVASLKRLVGFAGTDVGPITGMYAWDGSDWSALGHDSPPAITAGRGIVSPTEAATLIRRTVTLTSPILLPQLPDGVDQVLANADATGFSLVAMNDDRSIEVTIGIVVPGNSNLGAANKTVAFRRSSAEYQYIAADPTGWRSLWWIERPGHYPVPALKDQTGVPYALSATNMTEADFFALANSLR